MSKLRAELEKVDREIKEAWAENHWATVDILLEYRYTLTHPMRQKVSSGR